MKRILLLGGVTEALAIARTLGPEHIYSLGGLTRHVDKLAGAQSHGSNGVANGPRSGDITLEARTTLNNNQRLGGIGGSSVKQRQGAT